MEIVDQQRIHALPTHSTFLEEVRQLDVETFEVEDLVTLDQDATAVAVLFASSSSCSCSSCCSCSTSSCCSCSTSTS